MSPRKYPIWAEASAAQPAAGAGPEFARKKSSLPEACALVGVAGRTGHWVACGHQGFPAPYSPEPFTSSFLLILRLEKGKVPSQDDGKVSEEC